MADPARRVALLTHSFPGETATAVARLVELATASGVAVVGDRDEVAKHAGLAAGSLTLAEEPRPKVDLCVVFGGDGTILRALACFADSEVPVLAINFGTVGFLAAAERVEAEPAIAAALGGDYETVAMPGLEAEVGGRRLTALNDIAFARRRHGRVAELSYLLGGKEVGHVRCDGLVAATPSGSTGYNLANQGPILAWGVSGYVVSFIAPHTLTARALVVAPDDILTVHNAGGRDPVDITVDGQPAAELASGDDVEVRFREAVSLLAQMPGSNFYRRVREKFGQVAR